MSSSSIQLVETSPRTDEAEEHLLVVDMEDAGDGELESTKFEIRNLTRDSQSGDLILRGINVDLPKGMIVGIIGPSGSGKSTLLRALNRLWEPPSRTVFLDGRDITELDVLSLRRKVGMLFQLPVLFEGYIFAPQKELNDEEILPSQKSKGHMKVIYLTGYNKDIKPCLLRVINQ